MLTTRARRATLIGVAALGCTAAGTLAGLDAGAHVDRVYTTSPEVRVQPVPAPTPASSWEWNETPPVAIAPAGGIWGRDIGRDERAFFDTGVGDDGYDQDRPVRAHRRAREVAPAIEPLPPTGAASEGSDDGADQDAADAPPVDGDAPAGPLQRP